MSFPLYFVVYYLCACVFVRMCACACLCVCASVCVKCWVVHRDLFCLFHLVGRLG